MQSPAGVEGPRFSLCLSSNLRLYYLCPFSSSSSSFTFFFPVHLGSLAHEFEKRSIGSGPKSPSLFIHVFFFYFGLHCILQKCITLALYIAHAAYRVEKSVKPIKSSFANGSSRALDTFQPTIIFSLRSSLCLQRVAPVTLYSRRSPDVPVFFLVPFFFFFYPDPSQSVLFGAIKLLYTGISF